MRALLIIGFVAAVLLPSHARAWGPAGHRIICGVAWDEMKPGPRARVIEILQIETKQQFADLCMWADRLRFQEGDQTATWHYVEVPAGAPSVDIARDCSAEASCAVVQIGVQAQALKRDSGADKAMALKFLIHIVGDIHNPLHASDSRDRGGVDTYGEFLGRPMHLHAVWDTGILRADERPWEQIATELGSQVTPADRERWIGSTPLDWANESLTISRAPPLNIGFQGEKFTLGEDYARENLPIALRRLQQAGVRLGHLLDEALAP